MIRVNQYEYNLLCRVGSQELMFGNACLSYIGPKSYNMAELSISPSINTTIYNMDESSLSTFLFTISNNIILPK